MSEQVKPEDREAAVREWEQQVNRPLLADATKRRQIGGGLAILALAALVAVWSLGRGSKTEPHKPGGDSEVQIAERVPVPKLKEAQPASVPAVNAEPASTPAASTPAATVDAAQAQREQLELQRQETERRLLEARQKSSIVPPNTGLGAVGSSVSATSDGNTGTLGSGERGAQDTNSRYARAVSGNGVAVSKAGQITDLAYKILPGKLIEAVLEPRAISDLPGTLCATVQRDVYGAQGRRALIPWGSRVCGSYNAELRKGQDRLFVVWNEVWLPDGQHVSIDAPGADQLGTAGMGGHVDTHFAQIFGMSALLSIIGAGATNVGVSPNAQYNSAAYYRESVQQAAANTAQTVLQPYANMPPTVTVPHGSRVRIYVNRVLDFTDNYRDEIDAARGDGVIILQ